MINRCILTLLVVACVVVCVRSGSAASAAPAVTRDHLTEQEADLVRDAQELDKRTLVFIKAIDRRILVLTDAAAVNSTQVKKDLELWGPLPSGTHAELIADIAKILEEAIDNVDDVAARDDKNPLLSRAMVKLTEACRRFGPILVQLRDKSAGKEERLMSEKALEDLQMILDAGKG